MSSLQEARTRLASHFADGTADDGSKWAALWDKGDFLPWDRQMPNPALADVLTDRRDVLGLPFRKGTNEDGNRKQALVPGCGKGYDVLLLASFGYDAYGLEVSESAVEQCRKEQAKNGHKYPARDQAVGAGKVTFVHGDFFKAEWLRQDVGRRGKFDLIYDYTFLSALPEKSRPAWALRMSQLVSEMGHLICIEFPSTKDPKIGGPPYALPPPVYVEHLSHPGEELPYDNETGHVVQGSSRADSDTALRRIAHWQPARTHEIGKGPDGKVNDWVSIWQH